MTQVLSVLLVCIAASTVSGFLPNRARSVSFKRQSYLNAGLNVGDAVIAEVDDILGSVSDPKVSFLIRNEGKTTKASMSTKLLSSTERLALQTGSVMQVYISKVEGDDLVQVALKPADGSKPIVLREISADAKSELKTFKPVRVLTKAPKTPEPVAPKVPNGGLLLSNLKTGMELEGIVQSCTAYAAFVSAGVYRAGKAGSFQAINGMLHKVDIVDKSFLTVGSRKSSSRMNRGYDSGENAAEGIISVGTRIKVYVKEVYKQSGRLTLTTDPTIDKLRVREQKLEIRSAGNDRRRARRLRRQLEKVAVGDTVSGVVQQVIPAGILVSVNSLGPLNVTGLIAKRDLPKQFEVPPDLKESFQKQLLEQDFAVGRQITCGVLQVNPNIGDKVAYNLKMLFEELGALAADTVPVRDSGDKSEADIEDEDEESSEEVFDDSDLKEIFDELRGNKPLLGVSDLKDWGDVQDMIENNIIDLNDLEGAIQEVTGKPKGKALTLTFEQFVEIVDMLQDAMEGMTTDLDAFGDDDEDEEEMESVPPPALVKPAAKAIATPTPALSTPKQKMVLELEPVTEDTEDEDDDETMKEVAKELFDELRGKDSKLSVTAFKSWSDIADLVDNGLINLTDLDNMVKGVVGSSKQIDFNQFYSLVSVLDKMAEGDENDAGMEEMESEATDSDKPSVEIRRAVAMDGFNLLKGSNGKVATSALEKSAGVQEMLEDGVVTPDQYAEIVNIVAGSKKQLDFEEFFAIATKLDKTAEEGNLYLQSTDDEAETDGEDDEELSEDDLKEVAKELFDELRGKDKKVSVAQFMAWGDLKEMIEDGVVTKEQIMEIVSEAADGKKVLDFDQFYSVVGQLDEIVGDADEMDEMDDETMKEVAKELFDELRGKNAKLPVAAFKAWEDVKELISSGVLSKDDLDDMLDGKKNLDFDQFLEIVNDLDDMGEDEIGESDEEEEAEAETDGEDDEELSEDDLKEVAKELFDELRGKDKKVSVAQFMAWGDLKEMIEDGVVTKEQIMEIVSEAADGKKVLDFDQFYVAVSQLDELAEGEDMEGDDDMEDELDEEEQREFAMDMFNELRGKDKKVSVASIMGLEDVKSLIEDGLVSKEEILAIVNEAANGKTQLDFEQFFLVDRQLDSIANDASEDSETGDMNDIEEDEEPSEEEMKEMAKELFDELRGKEKKVSVAQFMAWEDVKDMIQDEVVTKEQIMDVLSEAADGKKVLDFDQFFVAVSQLDELAEGEDMEGDDDMEDEYSEEVDDDDEGMKEVAKELFDELRGKDKKVSVAQFMAWEDVLEMIKEKVVTKEEIMDILSEAADGKKVLDFDQFYEVVTQLDDIAGDLEDSEGEELDVEVMESSTGFGKKAAEVEEDEEDDDFEDMNDEEYNEMLQEVFADLKGKSKALSLKAFKKWEDIVEMIDTGIIDEKTVDELASKVGCDKGKDLTYPQFKALVELLDEVAGEDENDDSAEMSPRDGEREGDMEDRIEIDADEVGGDGNDDDEEMTPEEVEEMTRDLYDTLRGPKKTLSVATFLSWDNIQDQAVIDDETIDILLEEVGANKNRKGDLSYQQFSDLINMLDETVAALGDGEGQNVDTVLDDEDDEEETATTVSATLAEREEIDNEIEIERNERNVLDGIDDEGVDEIAKEIYNDLKGKSALLSVEDFKLWEDVVELVQQGIIQMSTVELLIAEVGATKTQTLTFDQFWQLVNLLEEASDAAADKVVADGDIDDIEMSDEEEAEMTLKVFNSLKNPKTGLVSAKKLKNWGTIAEALDSGEMSKGMLNAAIKKVGAELDFEKFTELLMLLEQAMEDKATEDEEPVAPVMNASGKGFARASEPPAVAVEEPKKAAKVPAPAPVKESDNEANAIMKEIFDELRGKGKTVSVETLKEWEDMQEMIEDGSLKRSSLEKALMKVGALATGELNLKQFVQLIDIIQGAVDDSNLKFEYEDEVKGFETSKKSSVLSSTDDEDDEEENWGDDESGGDFEELTEEEAARQAFDELVVDGAETISLVDFLQWEDVQELLEVGALSKDDLATAIENAGVSVEKDGIAFEKFYELLQVIDEFVDREKLPAEEGDVVFESKIIVDKDSNVDAVMNIVDGIIGEDGDEDNLQITYLSGKNGAAAAKGDAAIEAMQNDLDDDEEEDEEVLEMFEELSKGKDYITEKALRKWDELQELIEADLATQEVIDSYMARIEITNGRVSLKSFKHFMRMLDMVIVDESGNFLSMDDADRAVDIDSLDDEGETDEEEE